MTHISPLNTPFGGLFLCKIGAYMGGVGPVVRAGVVWRLGVVVVATRLQTRERLSYSVVLFSVKLNGCTFEILLHSLLLCIILYEIYT